MLKEVGRKLRFANHVGNLFPSRMQNASGSIENLARQKLAELRAKARGFYGVEVDPEISFDLRGMAAGQANYRENKIRLNRELLKKHEIDFIEQTVPHEYAHLVAYRKFGKRIRPHGKEWRSVMLALGAEPHRTNNYRVFLFESAGDLHINAIVPARITSSHPFGITESKKGFTTSAQNAKDS